MIWVAIAYFAASIASTTVASLPNLMAIQSRVELLPPEPDLGFLPEPGLEFPTVSVLHSASAAGVLLWGVASDFFATSAMAAPNGDTVCSRSRRGLGLRKPTSICSSSSGSWASPRRPHLPAMDIDGGAASHPALRKAGIPRAICWHTGSGNFREFLAARPSGGRSPNVVGTCHRSLCPCDHCRLPAARHGRSGRGWRGQPGLGLSQ